MTALDLPEIPDIGDEDEDDPAKLGDLDDSLGAVPVDPPEERAPVLLRALESRPIIPEWMLDAGTRQQAASWAVKWLAHTTAFHAVRTPVYAGKAVALAPRGVGVALRRLFWWMFDLDGRQVRLAAAQNKDSKAWLALSRERNERVKARLKSVWLGSVVAAIAALIVVTSAPILVQVLLGVLLVGVAAKVGQAPDKPIVSPAVSSGLAPRLNSGVVVQALTSIGLAGLSGGKSAPNIGFPSPITRDGPGWRADVDLPHGVTAAEVAGKRDKLASGLRRQVGAVWPEGDETQHDGRLVLWVGDKPMSEMAKPPWPLLKAGRADIFKPLPYGFDQRLRPIDVPLMFSNLLIGAIPRQGKTFSMRVLVLGASLDPSVEMHIHELKGTGDLSAVEPLSHRYSSGPADPATLDATMESIREVHSYLEPRASAIKALPRDVCPENKVTRQIADRRELRLHPVLLAIDECHELFLSQYGAEAEEKLMAIIRRGPALGIMLILATQRPDRRSLPTSISANAGLRLCLRVMGQVENDMILGTSMYQNGFRATTLTDRDRGIGYLAGVWATPRVVHGSLIDGPMAEKVAKRALAVRRAAGTLSGQAVGEGVPRAEDPTRLLRDVLEVWPAGDDWAWSASLADSLALFDERYASWEAADVTRALRKFGVASKQHHRTVDGVRQNRQGVSLEHIEAALYGSAES